MYGGASVMAKCFVACGVENFIAIREYDVEFKEIN
jgi:hypothetical protein